MNKTEFFEKVYELAFGEDAYNKGYSQEEVIDELEFLITKPYEAIEKIAEKVDAMLESEHSGLSFDARKDVEEIGFHTNYILLGE
jgi:hypothetical protein